MRYLLSILLIVFTGNAFSQNNINGYEYWFDNNDAVPTKLAVIPGPTLHLDTSISISSLSAGLHSLHIRFTDDSARYSQFVSQFFYKYTAAANTNNQVTGYQYWFDGNDATSILQNVTSTQTYLLNDAINIDTLIQGLHTFSIRFKDDGGKWSGVVSQFFYKYTAPQFGIRQITAFQYWFDGNDASGIVQNVAGTSKFIFLDSLSIASLLEGLHTFSVRFKDDAGKWSGIVSQFFYTYASPQYSSRQIIAYEYWFEADYAARITNSITPTNSLLFYDSLSLASLSDGLHTFSIRFKDDEGKWSGNISQFFSVEKKDSVHSNQITAYRYWFDDMDTSLNLVDLVPFINPYVMDALIPTDGIDSGRHVLHFQFKDANGVWSMVTTDSTSTNVRAVYTFIGNGNWSDVNNWANKMKPPPVLPAGNQIFIDPVTGGNCILNVPQQILSGAGITIRAGKSFIIPGDLNIGQ